MHHEPASVETTHPPIACPLCGAEVQVQLGMAPAVVRQAMRLQSARPGASAFCPECDSYFVYGPWEMTAELQTVSAGGSEDRPLAHQRNGNADHAHEDAAATG